MPPRNSSIISWQSVVVWCPMKNLLQFRLKSRGLKYCLGVIALLISQSALAQLDDAFTVIPPFPSSSAPFTVRIHGLWGSSPTPGFVPSRTTISGSIIRIDGCLPNVGFSTPSDYWVDAVIGPIAVGTYSVEYYSSTYCHIYNPYPPRLDVVGQVVVAAGPAVATSAIPTLNSWGVAILALVMLSIAYAFRGKLGRHGVGRARGH
jgi:hypothetical protein